MRFSPRLSALPVIAGLATSACGTHADTETVTIPFAAAFGTEAFDCTKSYANVGQEGATVHPLDFRFYVHDVTLVAADGTRAVVALENDGTWQRDGLALLDFENGSGTCTAGTIETRTFVRGTVPHGHSWTALEFKVGVPESMNHLDAARAPAPLNDPGLWWSWSGGFKYARLDLSTPGNSGGFFFHLGATDCSGAPASGFTCAAGNVATVRLDGFDPATKTVRMNLADFYKGLSVNATPDNQTDFVAGCMAFAGDSECPSMMGKFGLPFGTSAAPASQTFFTVSP